MFKSRVSDLKDLKTRIDVVIKGISEQLSVFVVVFENVSILMVLTNKILYSKNQ